MKKTTTSVEKNQEASNSSYFRNHRLRYIYVHIYMYVYIDSWIEPTSTNDKTENEKRRRKETANREDNEITVIRLTRRVFFERQRDSLLLHSWNSIKGAHINRRSVVVKANKVD